jgi:hypothetical protein
VKKPKWLGWESSETKSDDLKKVRRQTDQRMKQQERPKGTTGRGREEKSVALPSIAAPAVASRYWDAR